MAYAMIMVHVGIDDASDARVKLAGELADKFEAGVIGIAGWGRRPPFVVEGVIIESGPSAGEIEGMKTELAKMGEAFRAALGGVRHDIEWRADLEFPSELIVTEARAADLIVISGAERSPNVLRSVDPGTIMLKAGRPVLVVPNARASLSAKRILIAWKNTREARRAIRDSLPFLEKAEKVFIVEACRPGEEGRVRADLEDVARYLQRHSVTTATPVALPVKAAVAGDLIRVAQEEQIDLIVAGAYGHTRLGEWVFGGMTRDLLAASPVCCLFSH